MDIIYLILIIIFLLFIIGIGITLIIMNNENFKKLNKKSIQSTDFTIFESEYITDAETFGKKILLDNGSNLKYKTINLYGNFNDVTNKIPDISLAFSDTGDKWHVPGNTEIASLQKVNNNVYDFMLQMSNVPFKFTTAYIKGQVENLNCYIKLGE